MPVPTSDFGNSASNEAMSKAFKDLDAPFKQGDPSPQSPMTFGQMLVGLKFNPSNDTGVDKAKRLCAELMDLVELETQGSETSRLKNLLYQHTVGEILNAQMNVVKLITLKY